ncbi:hypothetical protein MRX96_058253 [Rhipicephalus microplus]
MYPLKGHVSPAPARRQRQVAQSDKWPRCFQEATEPWNETAKTVAAHISLSSSLMGPLNHRTTGVCNEESRCVCSVHSPCAQQSTKGCGRADSWLPVPHQALDISQAPTTTPPRDRRFNSRPLRGAPRFLSPCRWQIHDLGYLARGKHLRNAHQGGFSSVERSHEMEVPLKVYPCCSQMLEQTSRGQKLHSSLPTPDELSFDCFNLG